MPPRVVVVGAGIIGAFASLELARADHEVTLVDAGTDCASVGNAGLLVPSYSEPMSTPTALREGVLSVGRRGSVEVSGGLCDPIWLARFTAACLRPVGPRAAVLTSLAARSIARYDVLAAQGTITAPRETGWLWPAASASELASVTATVSRCVDAGVEAMALDANQARVLEPALGPDLVGAGWFPRERVVDPATLLAEVLQAARSAGVVCVAGEVDSLDRRDGNARRVKVSGSLLEADAFVLCLGAWWKGARRRFGMAVPVRPGRGWHLELAADLERPVMLHAEHIVASPVRPGVVRLTSGMRLGTALTEGELERRTEAMHAATLPMLPHLADATPLGRWQGARPMSPSGLPIVRAYRNVVVATGHGTLGMTLAPETAHVVAGLIKSVS